MMVAKKIQQGLLKNIKRFSYSLKHIWQEDEGFVLQSRNNAIKAKSEYIILPDGDMI